jgi:hypothetical protein
MRFDWIRTAPGQLASVRGAHQGVLEGGGESCQRVRIGENRVLGKVNKNVCVREQFRPTLTGPAMAKLCPRNDYDSAPVARR